MRSLLSAVAVLALAACASAPAPTPAARDYASSGTWVFAFDAGPGIASATLANAAGETQLRITCVAPHGDLTVTDWTFSRARQGDVEAVVSVGAAQQAVSARISGDGAGRQALMYAVPPQDPVFAALTPASVINTAAAGYTHAWAAGAASRLNDVINACRQLGS
jgi:hypothetical protein